MYLFSRTLQVNGDLREVMPRAIAMRELVTQKTGLQVSLWTAVLGQPVGTLGYTTFVQSLAELDAAQSVLIGDAEYLERLADTNAFVVGAPQDSMIEILHNAGGEYRRADVGAVASLITAQVANARFGAGIQWGIEMAELAAGITHRALFLGRYAGGAFGQLAWISSSPDMATFESENEALGKDARYLTQLDSMGDVFVQGSGHISLLKRIA